MSDNTGWLDYVRLCWRGKWIILIFSLAGFAYGWYQYLQAPLLYEAEISLLIQDVGPGLPSGGGIGGLLQLGQASSQEQTILNILQSRQMAKNIAKHFEFEKRYNISEMAAMKKVMSMVIPVTYTKLLVIKIRGAEEKQLAIDIAHFCVQHLGSFNTDLNINSSKSWVQVLDPPELSVKLGGREKERRFMIMYAMLGFTLGVAGVIGFPKLLKLRQLLSLAETEQ